MLISLKRNLVSFVLLICLTSQKRQRKDDFKHDYFNAYQKLKISILDVNVARSLLSRLKEHSERFNGDLNQFSLFKSQKYQENPPEIDVTITLVIEGIIKDSASNYVESRAFRSCFKRLKSVYSDFLELTNKERILNSLRYLPIQESLNDLENITDCLKKKFPGNQNIKMVEESVIGNAKSLIDSMLIFKDSQNTEPLESKMEDSDGTSLIQNQHVPFNDFVNYSEFLFKVLQDALKNVDMPDDVLFKSYNSFKILETVFKIFIWNLMTKNRKTNSSGKSFLRLMELLPIFRVFSITKRSALKQNLLKSLNTPIEAAGICTVVCNFLCPCKFSLQRYEPDDYNMKILENIDESLLSDLKVSPEKVRNHGIPFGKKSTPPEHTKSTSCFRKYCLIFIVFLIIMLFLSL